MSIYDTMPTEKVDEIWKIVINHPSSISKKDFDGLRKRWHELHDNNIKGNL